MLARLYVDQKNATPAYSPAGLTFYFMEVWALMLSCHLQTLKDTMRHVLLGHSFHMESGSSAQSKRLLMQLNKLGHFDEVRKTDLSHCFVHPF